MTVDDPNRRLRSADTGGTIAAADNVRIPDLKPFADQLMLIAQHLRDGNFQAARSERSPSAAAQSTGEKSQSQRIAYAEIARQHYSIRRKRAAIFGNPELFGEPGWDILLDLYIALAKDQPVSVSSACIGSASPPTTGLRWLGILAENGLVAREQDPADQRRVLVRLTEAGAQAMDRYFALACAD